MKTRPAQTISACLHGGGVYERSPRYNMDTHTHTGFRFVHISIVFTNSKNGRRRSECGVLVSIASANHV